MKHLLSSLLLLAGFISLSAQDCKGYYYLSNSEVQMTTYGKKGEESGKLTYKISDIKKEASGTTASFTSEMVNEKGKTLSKGAGKYKCTGGVMFIDAKASLPGDQMEAYKDMEVKADDAFIEYPANLSEGQTLKDANFKMQTYSKSTLNSTITFDEINRKVIGKETITTPAGTWECWKITYDGKFKAQMAPLNIGIPFSFQCTEWFAPGFGIVKSETKNKNGKLMGSMMITALKK